jgi:hypothetical protein
MSELLVPVRADAMWLPRSRRVVGPPADVERLPWFDGRRDRNGSVPHIASAINAPPFGEHSGWLDAGVHLHWSLPDALTRGSNRPDAVRTVHVDGLWFAPAPNRWLVMLRLPARDPARTVRRWLVESDHVHAPDARPSRAVAYPLPGAAPGTPPYVHIGRQIEFEPDGNAALDPSLVPSTAATSMAGRGATLTALGPGDPLFAAHYPSCQSVFGFHEAVPAAELGEPREYLVFGWYRELGADPLTRLGNALQAEPLQALSLLARNAREDAARLLLPTDPAALSPAQRELALRLAIGERFGWAVDDASLQSVGAFPHLVLCMGSTTLVTGDEPQATEPAHDRAGIGASGAEALAALLMDGATLDTAQQDRLVHALAATDLASHTLDAGLKLAEARHTEQFQARRGHAIWVIRAPETHDAPGQRAPAELPEDLAQDLNQLNALQEAYDRAQDRITGLREALFADWHRWMSAAYPEGDADPFAVDVDALRELIERTRLEPLEALCEQTGQLFHGRTGGGGVVLTDRSPTPPKDRPVPAGPEIGENSADPPFIEVVAQGRKLLGFDLYLWGPGILSDIVVASDGPGFAPRRHGGHLQAVRLDDGEWVTALFGEAGSGPHDGIVRLGFETNRQRRLGPWGRDRDNRRPFRLEAPLGLAVVGLRGTQNVEMLQTIGIIVAPPSHMEPLPPDPGGTLAGRVVEQFKDIQVRLASASAAERPLTLGVAPGPRFWRPNDPVLVLDDPVAAASPRHGEDGRGQPDGLHPCQAISVCNSPGDVGYTFWPAGPPGGLRASDWLPFLAQHPEFANRSEGENWHPIQLEWEVEVQPLLDRGGPGDNDDRDVSNSDTYATDFVTRTHTLPLDSADLVPRPGLRIRTTGETVCGRTILNPAAGRLLQERLPMVPADLPLPAKALAAFAAPARTAPMVLTLGGFHDQLLLRQQEPQIAIADPIGLPAQRAFTGRVRYAVGALHPTTPVDDGPFHPLRSGEMLIERLRVIDSFGRTKTWRPERLLKTARMQPEGGAFDRARLPLRLTQAARLDFRWLSAQHGDIESNDHPATSPVCGWLLPDDLDGEVEVYARSGRLLGSVGAGGAWTPAPGDATAPSGWRELDDPALQRVVRWLTAPPIGTPPADAVGTFVDLLDGALERIDPKNSAQHQARAMLIGRPVAVVRARLALSLQHGPVPDPSMTALRARIGGAADDHHGLLSVEMPVRLGELNQHDDGLCGYWVEEGTALRGDLFHTPHGLEGGAPHPRIRVLGEEPLDTFPVRLTPDGAPAFVTLLIDPRGVVHASCGVLPVKSIAVPPEQFVDQVAALRATFRVAPVLTAPDAVDLPLPGEPGYAWSWLERDGDTWNEVPHHPTVRKAELVAGFGNVGPALWDLLVETGRLVLADGPAVGLLMPGDPAVPPARLAALGVAPEALERGLHALARSIGEADSAARFGARAVARDGWLQLRPSPQAQPVAPGATPTTPGAH